MLFVISCEDKAESADLRMATRPAHLDYIKGFADNIVMVGPTLTDDGEGMNGSLLIMDFPDRAAAEAYAEGDPYFKAGLFATVTIKRWKKVLPAD